MAYPKFEYKYLLPLDRLDSVRNELLPLMGLDPWADKTGRGSYTVRSIYFDDTNYSAYREKYSGERKRRKFRVRAYNEFKAGNIAYLEIKRKKGGQLTKYRSALAAEHVEALFTERDLEKYILPYRQDAINKENAGRFFYHYYKHRLKPVILVIYEREAFISRYSDDLRVTLDRNLHSIFTPGLGDLYDNSNSVIAMQHHCILEIKFTVGVPLALRQIIQRHDLKRMALSKYTICLDSHSAFRDSHERYRIVNLNDKRKKISQTPNFHLF